MTAVLQLLRDIAQHLAVQTSVTPEQLRDLMKKTTLNDSRIGWTNWRSLPPHPCESVVASEDLRAAS